METSWNFVYFTVYSILQDKVNSITPPTKVGRIPRKIQANFSSFTADEWKNRILLYSVYSLYDVIPEADFKCWYLFVDSCHILCQSVLTTSQVSEAHDILVNFCERFESLYGKDRCTPNMHVACHLKECILDYGPLSSFWCFPFERYNGFLEGLQKSWNGPEKQMMYKFLNMQHIHSLQHVNDEDKFVYEAILNMSILGNINTAGSYSSFDQTTIQDITTVACMKNMKCSPVFLNCAEEPHQNLIKPFYEKGFSDSEFNCLRMMYSVVYPNSTVTQLSRFYLEARKMLINGEEHTSEKSPSERSSIFAAHWPGVLGIDPHGEAELRAGSITCFIQHKIAIDDCNHQGSVPITHNLVRIKWFQGHPERTVFHRTVICCSSVYEADSEVSFILVSRISSRCAFVQTTHRFTYGTDSIVACIPLQSNS